MVEKFLEITCDGCGDTSMCDDPNGTAREYRDTMRDLYGWRNYGRLDYCRDCVADGKARDRAEGFGT